MSSKPRVMFAITNLLRGGAQTQIVAVATGLAQRDWEVAVVSLTPQMDGLHQSELEAHGVSVLSLNYPENRRLSTLFCPLRMLPILNRRAPHVLVGFLYQGIMTSRIAGFLADVPVVVSSVRNERTGAWQDRLFRLTDGLSDVVTTMSERIASGLSARGAVSPSHRVHVIPNGVDLEKFNSDGCRTELRRSLGVENDDFLWLAVGGLREQKDYPNLLRAFSIVSKNCPSARLAIVGEGNQAKKLELLTQQLGLSKQVMLLGKRIDMPNIYRTCDAFALSSAWEGMANVVLEAMACKRPVVATAAGGITEVIRDGEDGFVVPIRDHLSLAQAMSRTMNLSDSARMAMGESGYNRVREQFSRDRIVDMWEKLLRRKLREKGLCTDSLRGERQS